MVLISTSAFDMCSACVYLEDLARAPHTFAVGYLIHSPLLFLPRHGYVMCLCLLGAFCRRARRVINHCVDPIKIELLHYYWCARIMCAATRVTIIINCRCAWPYSSRFFFSTLLYACTCGARECFIYIYALVRVKVLAAVRKSHKPNRSVILLLQNQWNY